MKNDESRTLLLTTWLAYGWLAFKRDPLPLMGGSVMLTAVSLALAMIPTSDESLLIAALVQITVGPVLHVGWCHLCLRHLRGEETWATDIFKAFRLFGPALITSLLYSLIVIAGCLLLIIPGIIWACKFCPCVFVVMDRRIGSPLDAIQLSGAITRGHVGKLFCFGLLSFLLSLITIPFMTGCGLGFFSQQTDGALIAAGVLPYLVSVLVVSPWLGVSLAAAYDKLLSASNAAEVTRFPAINPLPRRDRSKGSGNGSEGGDDAY
jgi:hypothetical protein